MRDNEIDVLDTFTLLTSDDPVKRDLEVTCDGCGEIICDAEHGDTVATLVRTVLAHDCS